MCYDFGMLHNLMVCDADQMRDSSVLAHLRALTTVEEMERAYMNRRHEDGKIYRPKDECDG